MQTLPSQIHIDHCSFMARQAIATMLYVPFCMAIDTPRHSHRGNSGNSIHRFDRAVAFLTLDGRLRHNVPLVREVYVIGKVVNLDPGNRLAIFPVCRKFQNFRTLADTGKRIVTSHAFGNAGYAGYGGLVSVDVTVLARN